MLKTLFGMLTPRSGEIRALAASDQRPPAAQLLGEGMAFVPQGRNLFGSLSVLHNLELGGLQLPKKLLRERIDEVMELFPRLKAAHRLAGRVTVRRRAETTRDWPCAAGQTGGDSD